MKYTIEFFKTISIAVVFCFFLLGGLIAIEAIAAFLMGGKL